MISIQLLKQSGFTYQILMDCINDAIKKALFPNIWVTMARCVNPLMHNVLKWPDTF